MTALKSVATGGLLCLVALALLLAYFHRVKEGLPYRDSFAADRADEWQAFGGTWELHDGAMYNSSDERGAKLVVGSSAWHNYSVEADVMLLAEDGDAGLLIRSSDEEVGVDAYSGYYAGLRKLDNSLVLGRADHGWIEDNVPLQPHRVEASRWYHVKVLAYGCRIVAAATALQGSGSATMSVDDESCIDTGRAGLRSYRSGGIWRNVVVRRASELDVKAMLGETAANAVLSSRRFGENRKISGFQVSPLRNESFVAHYSSSTESINTLRLVSFAIPTDATVRGSVVVTSPILIVEDSTGGVMVPNPINSPSLRIGDQVEVHGRVQPSDFGSSLQSATIRPLWGGSPIPPVTVTALQAATGAFDTRLVEVEGRLVGRHYGANHDLVFELASGAETFNAVLERGRGDYVFEKMKPDSLLRVRGVCVVESSLTEDLTPFALLLRSTDDMEVLADPPWWNAGHAAALAIGTLLIGFAANFCFNWVERWRLRAILEERESLAHEMHDTLAQSFAGIGFQLEAIRSSVPDNLETTHRQLNLASDLVRHSHKEARRSISTLRAETYDSGKLLPSLEQCARRMVEGGGVRIVTRTSGSQAPVSPRVMDTLYRIGQEAIANSIRHARPTSLAIELRFCSQWLRLIIADDGIGFAPGADSSGFGVRGMRKRALSISADLQIYSQPGEGTQVQVKVSLPPRATFVSWPIVLSRYMKERLRYGRSTRQTDSHLYRG